MTDPVTHRNEPIPFKRPLPCAPHVAGEATLAEALAFIREATGVFVWCQLAPHHGRFFKVDKDEVLRSLERWQGPYVELSVAGENVWLG